MTRAVPEEQEPLTTEEDVVLMLHDLTMRCGGMDQNPRKVNRELRYIVKEFAENMRINERRRQVASRAVAEKAWVEGGTDVFLDREASQMLLDEMGAPWIKALESSDPASQPIGNWWKLCSRISRFTNKKMREAVLEAESVAGG